MRFPLRQPPKQLIESLFQKRFSQRPTLWTQTSAQTQKIATQGRRALWIVSRGLTRHQIFSFPEALPEAKRRLALGLQVRKSFPFKDPAFAAFWKGNEASVYAWDAEVVRAAQLAAGLPVTTQSVPETFIRTQGQTGVRLATMLDGFEGQLWVNGFLKTSRWWPVAPTVLEWAKFLRSIGLSPTEEMAAPLAEEQAFLERPWTEGAFSLDDWSSLLQSRRVQAIAATVVVCPFIFLGAQIATVSFAEGRLKTELAALSTENQAVRADRSAAYGNLDAIEGFLKLDEYPPQVQVLSVAMKALADTGAPRIVSWNFDRGNLEIVLRAEQSLDPTAYITLFERDPLFEGVSGTFSGPERDLQLRMTVTKRVRS